MHALGIDLFSEQYWNRHAEVEDALRARGAAHRAVLPNGVPTWVVTGYEAARAALANPLLSKDSALVHRVMTEGMARAGHRGAQLSEMFHGMLFSDPPEHKRLRDLVVRHFTPKRIAAMRPRIEQISTDLLASFRPDTPVDLVAQYAFAFPVTVICELMGIPLADREPFRAWTTDLMEDHPAVVGPANDAMRDYFAQLIAAKRREPGNDLLSALVNAGAETGGLTDDEILGICFLVFVAGHETSTNLIGNAAHAALRHNAWATLAADPLLVPGAIRETLRIDSPVRMATHRVTTEPTTIGDTTIPQHEVVLVCLGAANRDPARFPRPTDFDIHRQDAPDLAFGHGIHYCLGSALGRLEAEVALTHLTGCFPNTRLAEQGRPDRRRSVITNGFSRLLVTPHR
jgi:cytochrome P450